MNGKNGGRKSTGARRRANYVFFGAGGLLLRFLPDLLPVWLGPFLRWLLMVFLQIKTLGMFMPGVEGSPNMIGRSVAFDGKDCLVGRPETTMKNPIHTLSEREIAKAVWVCAGFFMAMSRGSRQNSDVINH